MNDNTTAWIKPDDALPADGEWVLHSYCGVRAPLYGIHQNGKFHVGEGPETLPTTHWLPVPVIVSPRSESERDADELRQEILDRMRYFYQKINGTFEFPNSAEGDLLKMVNVYLQNTKAL